MNLEDLLESLSEKERDFIARLDYVHDANQHRTALDGIVAAGGIVDFPLYGYWYPYEVVELGKNGLQVGHEREYAACLGIVLRNIEQGTDLSNDLEYIIETEADSISQLPSELNAMITELVDRILNTANQIVD